MSELKLLEVVQYYVFVAFCSFFPCSLTVFIHGRQQKSGGRQQKSSRADKQQFSIGLDNEKALELENRTIFSYFSLLLIKKYHPKMQQNILLHSGMITPNILVKTQFFVV